LLADGMRGESPLLRRVSVVAAGRYGDSALIGDIASLLDDNDAEVREGAIEALSCLAGEDGGAVQRVAVDLSGDGDPEKRRNSARLFAALGDGDRLSAVRRNAVNALASLEKGPGGSQLLMALVDEDADVRAAVAEALGESGGDEVVAPLLLVLKDEDPAVRCAALKSLGKLRPAGARQAIVELLDSPGDGLLTISALNTLAEIDGEGASEPVKKALANPDEEVVKTAMDILSRFGDDWLDEYREMLLCHPHWDVRRNFIRVLVENRGAKAVPYLESALETESDDLVKEQILNTLDRLK
jgi:HEAT repeat protein